MEKLLKQRVEILAQEVDKMKSGGAGEGYTKAEADAKFLSKDDASTALAGKQDSLDQTQLAAVNSGIDSTKVSQIETNKTNILYSLGKTGKNLINIADVTMTEEGFVIDVTYISPLPAGSYVFSYTSNQEESGGAQFKARIGITELAAPVITSKSGKNIIPFTISSTADNISLYSLRAGTYSNFMLCTQADYDVSPDYQPYRGLPNYDLTQLQSEDRAALVEVVDEGAKNIFDISTPESLRDTTVTPLGNGGAKLSCNNATWTQYHKSIATKTGEKYKFAVYIDSITGSIGSDFNIYVKRENASDDDPYFVLNPTETGVYTADLTALTSVTVILIYINNSGTAKTLDVNMRVMFCSEADWNVSQAYQPYRPSYQELYEMVLALQTTRTATTRKTTKAKTNEE